MSNISRVLVPVLLLALLGGAWWLYSLTSGDQVPGPGPVNPPPPSNTTVIEQQPPVAPETAAGGGEQQPDRQPVRVEAVSDNTHAEAPQGVKGRVLLPSGQPAAGVPLFLMENMMNDPFEALLRSKSGQTLPPISWGATAADGTFALGVSTPDMEYDLRIVSDDHPEVNHKSIKVRSEDWYDTGDLRLEVGELLRGRVIDELTKGGVPDATVFMQVTNNMHTVLPTPGRERGIAAITDPSGAFAIACAPGTGAVTLTAEAPGYATTVLNNRPGAERNDVFTIEIARGQPIAGVVVDEAGKPLRGVQVRAQGLSVKTPQNATTTTLDNGTFQFPSLREGPYELSTTSGAHADGKSPPVMTGETDVKLVLTLRPWVKLKVLSAAGKEVKAYHLALMRYFPNNAVGIGKVPEFKDRRITPAYYPSELGGGWAAIRGLPASADQFCFQIEERGHAKTLSEPFSVQQVDAPTEVVVRLTLGAAITGTVIDDLGKPVRGASVSTDMNNAFDGDIGGIFGIFRKMMPEKHSTMQTRTDGQGRFRLSSLAFAEYMLRVHHPDFCEGKSFDIRLEQEGQIADIGTVQLNRGAIIEGFTTLNGQAIGQVKVSLSVPPEDQPKPAPAESGQEQPVRMPFSASTISDNSGRYKLLKRVPPGRYKVAAARQSGEQNPFAILMDMKDTERIIEISPGQDRLKIDFALPTR